MSPCFGMRSGSWRSIDLSGTRERAKIAFCRSRTLRTRSSTCGEHHQSVSDTWPYEAPPPSSSRGAQPTSSKGRGNCAHLLLHFRVLGHDLVLNPVIWYSWRRGHIRPRRKLGPGLLRRTFLTDFLQQVHLERAVFLVVDKALVVHGVCLAQIRVQRHHGVPRVGYYQQYAR